MQNSLVMEVTEVMEGTEGTEGMEGTVMEATEAILTEALTEVSHANLFKLYLYIFEN